MLLKLIKLRDDFLLKEFNVVFYDYQKQVSDRLLEALIKNLRITTGATEKEVKKLTQEEFAVEFSRQSGKTTAIAYTVIFIVTFLPKMFDRAIRIGIFAPQKPQADVDFERIKTGLRGITQFNQIQTEDEKQDVKERENARTVVLPNGSSIFIAPISKTSKAEAPTLDLIVVEECQDADDNILITSVFPMGASTNAPRVLIGTAGTRLCYFRTVGMRTDALKLYYDQIVVQRKAVYDVTKDPTHLIYEQTVKSDIEKFGINDDNIQRPYFGKWLIGTGQFTTEEELDALIDPERKRRTYQEKTYECFVGIDTAKHPDSTVVTIIRYNKDKGKKELLNWLKLHGDNYKDQFDIIHEFIKNYKVRALAIDSTGQGDFMPDMFERETEWVDENSGLYRVKFSAVSKDMMYKNLKVTIKELLTTLPILDTKEAGEFRQQMLDLQQEYKGQLLSCHHPDSPDARDDFCDSFALAEHAYAKYNENYISYSVVGGEPKERNAERDEQGKIVNYWPGLDDYDI